MARLTPDSTIPLATGRGMPVLGLGTWKLNDDTAASVADALELGYRLIDTSGDYGTQPAIGRAIAGSGVDRRTLYLVTKVEEDDDAYDATRRNLDELNLQYADLVLIHRPPEIGPGVGLWDGLVRAREEGLAHDIGVSNYTSDQIEALEDASGVRPVVNQIEWSPFGWSPSMLDWSRENEVVLQAFSPLTRQKRLDDRRLRELAARYDATPAQLILRWDIQLGVVPLPKAGQRKHQEENLGVFDFTLSDRHVDEVGKLNEHYSAFGGLAYV